MDSTFKIDATIRNLCRKRPWYFLTHNSKTPSAIRRLEEFRRKSQEVREG